MDYIIIKSSILGQLIGVHHGIAEHLAVEAAVFYWSVMTLSHKRKPQSNHFQIQIHSACVSHSHTATKVEKEAVCVSITLHNKQLWEWGESAPRQTDGGDRAGLGWVCCRASCAFWARVSQAVSGSCDQKLSAQQLETTYVTRLQPGIR